MKTIEARVIKNIKEDPSVEECDIWNIEATLLDPLPFMQYASPRILSRLGLTNSREQEWTARALQLPYEPGKNRAYNLVK